MKSTTFLAAGIASALAQLSFARPTGESQEGTENWSDGHKTKTTVDIPDNLSTRVLRKDVYGYSFEPGWMPDFVASDLTANLLEKITRIVGTPPPVRVGGNTADVTFYKEDLNATTVVYPSSSDVSYFNVTSAWYEQWGNYFPENTELIYTLNFGDMQNNFANAIAEAKAVIKTLGSKLRLIEIGNEVDHFVGGGYRSEPWGVAEYIPQWRNISDRIMDADWYKNQKSPPDFQAGVIADPPWVPDQRVSGNDFDTINLTRAGLVDPDYIKTYAMHLYPQSTCDTDRWLRMRLDLLSNHTVMWLNISQYVPQVAAAEEAGSVFVLGETNSISCGGHSGISDTFGAALWGVDYVLGAASIGAQQLYFHQGAQSEYSSFTPIAYEYKGENLTAGIRAPYYGHYFISKVVSGSDTLHVAALPEANSSSLSGYGIYGSSNQLKKMVFLDMGVWNGTEGLSNPSTLSSTDSSSHSNGTRPVREMQVRTSWTRGKKVALTRLSAPGTNAKSDVNVSGVSFDSSTGATVGKEKKEHVKVGKNGLVTFEIPQAGAVLLELSESHHR